MGNQHILVVGSGVAGLTCALSLIELGHEVTVITKSQTSDSATWYAQGGVASAMFPDDSESSHIEDTLAAGAGLCNYQAVEVLVRYGSDAVRKLISRGAQFDTLADGSYARAREGGHHSSRIIHAGGDATGEEIERTLVKAAGNKPLQKLKVIDFHMVTKILQEKQSCIGIECIDAEGTVVQLLADHVVLATGGAGQLYSVTTNPVLATADGVAIALDSGVLCTDLEFMQFHPTALHVDNMPRPLLSEALRGEGSILRDENGVAFMKGVHELADLAPRDVVSREIAKVIREHKIDHVYLDATMIKDFANHFPTIYASTEAADINPSEQYLPVSPAAHYYCGGIVTDTFGATSMKKLWAAGEVACNGVHGANRLASNSLLDGLVFGERVAESIHKGSSKFEKSGLFSYFDIWDDEIKDAIQHPNQTEYPQVTAEQSQVSKLRRELQKTMTLDAGVVRSQEYLEAAYKKIFEISTLATLGVQENKNDFSQVELSHLLRVAQCLIGAAIARQESRGCHTRDDYSKRDNKLLGHYMITSVGDNPIFVGETPR